MIGRLSFTVLRPSEPDQRDIRPMFDDFVNLR